MTQDPGMVCKTVAAQPRNGQSKLELGITG